MKKDINKNSWAFIVDWPKREILIPKRKSYELYELVGVLTAINDLQQALLEMIQSTLLENAGKKK